MKDNQELKIGCSVALLTWNEAGELIDVNVEAIKELYAENQSLKTEIDFFRGIADENQALKAAIDDICNITKGKPIGSTEYNIHMYTYNILNRANSPQLESEAALQSKEE